MSITDVIVIDDSDDEVVDRFGAAFKHIAHMEAECTGATPRAFGHGHVGNCTVLE